MPRMLKGTQQDGFVTPGGAVRKTIGRRLSELSPEKEIGIKSRVSEEGSGFQAGAAA